MNLRHLASSASALPTELYPHINMKGGGANDERR
nr:MAG TPA: hypothetical protein [Caudoviricetes sp.]